MKGFLFLSCMLFALPFQQFVDDTVPCQELNNSCERFPEDAKIIGDDTPLYPPYTPDDQEPTTEPEPIDWCPIP